MTHGIRDQTPKRSTDPPFPLLVVFVNARLLGVFLRILRVENGEVEAMSAPGFVACHVRQARSWTQSQSSLV